ncbi:hypothetical protein DFQ27_006206, partial [Actinomortierella ambigua]
VYGAIAQTSSLAADHSDLVEYEANSLATHERRRRPRHRTHQAFNLVKWSDELCISHCQFTKARLSLLKQHLMIPDLLWTSNNDQFTGLDGPCVLLCRLSYPKRLTDTVLLFGRDKGTVSRILKAMIEWFHVH